MVSKASSPLSTDTPQKGWVWEDMEEVKHQGTKTAQEQPQESGGMLEVSKKTSPDVVWFCFSPRTRSLHSFSTFVLADGPEFTQNTTLFPHDSSQIPSYIPGEFGEHSYKIKRSWLRQCLVFIFSIYINSSILSPFLCRFLMITKGSALQSATAAVK